MNPLGKAPVITDGEVNISESGAIIGEYLQCMMHVLKYHAQYTDIHGRTEYIIRKYGQGKITEPEEGTQGAIDDIYCESRASCLAYTRYSMFYILIYFTSSPLR